MKFGFVVIQIRLRAFILFIKHFMILLNINYFVTAKHNGLLLDLEE